eukprot:CAMPEP_0206141516 /NCGR_PEP_ID=MMETSP1473-20131121/13205_1 /ASSEMBLY_ACC=CAM_ASM_001109 /TAXON_ID=1461547 /ORGANISM="Stichococcus sp, Strain RCC1054" /LENGTH=1055 /DNA_ID=CAMNT_0053536117 /DNA_START=143 /DNA_END=3310 /DNA_ORIENTATION=+
MWQSQALERMIDQAFSREVEEVLAFFSVNLDSGLSRDQVEQARERYGPNALPAEDGTPFWKLVLKQFDDYLVKILIVAAVVDLIIALANGERGAGAFVEPGIIVLILLANAAVGVITETNAEKAIEELKAYEADNATVLREGRLAVLPAAQLVPGDVVDVAVGGNVPADLRVAQRLSAVLRCDQSILTGESGSVEKQVEAVLVPNAVVQDKKCMMFSGTVVTAGRARCVVVGTGSRTAIGKIHDAMASQEEEMSPLKKKLDEFGSFLSKAIAVICVLVWVINIRHFKDPVHGGWLQGCLYYFKIAVALAVAAIPEGLPAVVTTCLALGTRKMAQQNAIVRTLPSVETLGCTTVICSDKTGTLTTNMMSVARLVCLSDAKRLARYQVSGTTFAPEGEIREENGQSVKQPGDVPCLLAIGQCSALCNDSSLYYDPDRSSSGAGSSGGGTTGPSLGGYHRIGEATEVALRVLAEKIGLEGYAHMPDALRGLSRAERVTYCNDAWRADVPRLAVLDFSRDRKMMSVLTASPRGGSPTLFLKGAPEAVLSRCTNAIGNAGGRSTPFPLTPALRAAIMQQVEELGSTQALRCLAFACRTMAPSQHQVTLEDEAELTFLGVAAMHDPPRPEVGPAIATCRSAGIRVLVVTGDNKATAEAVCRAVGVLDRVSTQSSASLAEMGASDPDNGTALTGAEFDQLTGSEQKAALNSMAVFARVEPSHKQRLVELLKAQGHVVAMTGDGVNDAPALRRADIGIAMGTGTAVAKHAADMVLADDNFATIVSAVAEGRSIYANTKQFIRYMVSSNIGEVVAIFVAALLGMPEVLNPVQLLWVNLVTDGLPATALGFNPPEPGVMASKPRKTSDSIVSRWLVVRYFLVGLYVGLATAAGFIWFFLYSPTGPKITYGQLTTFQSCEAGKQSYNCDIFLDRRPRTIAMTVLVVVEMFNALNALSENASLVEFPPWRNLWLLGAIGVSMLLHFFILYVPWAATLFSVSALSWVDWKAIVCLSAPVVLLDEVLKVVSRHWFMKRPRRGPVAKLLGGMGSRGSKLGLELAPLKADL